MLRHFANSTFRGLALLSLALGFVAFVLASPSSASAETCYPSEANPVNCSTLNVQVLNASTLAPVNNATVKAEDLETGAVSPLLTIATLAPGEYTASLTPGTYVVSAAAPGYRANSFYVTLQPGQGYAFKLMLAPTAATPKSSTTTPSNSTVTEPPANN